MTAERQGGPSKAVFGSTANRLVNLSLDLATRLTPEERDALAVVVHALREFEDGIR